MDFQVRRLVGVKVTRIDGQGFDLRVRCELENTNKIGAKVSQIRFRTYLGRHLLGEGQLAGPVEVGPGKRFTLEVPVRVTYGSLPADLPRRVEGGSVRLRTEASFVARTRLGSYNMRLTSTGKTRVAEALKVAIRGSFKGDALKILAINLGDLKLRRVQLKARIRARNLFAFPIRIRRGVYAISINGSHFGDGKFDEPMKIAPRSSVERTMTVAASHGAVGSAIVAMMGAEPRFRLKGTLWIDPIGGVGRLPLDLEADASIFGR
jgi:LEA14-like dessication related protein